MDKDIAVEQHRSRSPMDLRKNDLSVDPETGMDEVDIQKIERVYTYESSDKFL